MVVIAVAGGAGDLGRAIVEELIRVGKFEVVILSRKPSTTSTGANEPDSIFVNYDDVDETAFSLQSHGIHTIVSALAVIGPGEQSQLNLIAAADKSSTTQRFIPSEYTGHVDGDPSGTDPMGAVILHAREALAKTGLKTTHFSNGVFMDYYGHPHIPSTLRPFKWAIDIPSRRAAIPGTGDEVITMTYSKDVASFIARLMDDDEWPKFSRVSGADTCFNEILAIAERVTGEKFHVTYDSFEDIKAGKATPVLEEDILYGGMRPSELAVVLGMTMISGEMALPIEGRLNERYPEIRPTGIKELLEKAWSTK